MSIAPTIAGGDRVSERAPAEDTALNRDDEDETKASLAASNVPLNQEELHILLTYSILLALTRHPSQPVVDLDIPAQVRQLDAFLAGDVTEEGVATHWSVESQRTERLRQYQNLCDQLVPNLTATIKKQS